MPEFDWDAPAPGGSEVEECLSFTRRLACIFYRFRQKGFEHLGKCSALAHVEMFPTFDEPNLGNDEDKLAVLTPWRFCLVCYEQSVPTKCYNSCSGCGGIRASFLQRSYGNGC